MAQPLTHRDAIITPPVVDMAGKPGTVNLISLTSTDGTAGDARPASTGAPATTSEAAVAKPEVRYLNLNSSAAATNADVASSVKRVLNDAAGTMSANQKADFQSSVDQFLKVAQRDGLSADEITRTLDSTSRLLEGRGDQPLDAQKRAWLAESLMHNVANPNRCDQGFHNTCNVTAISKVVMAHDPAKMADIVSSSALNGCYKASDGAIIKLDANSMQPDSEVAGGQTLDNKRNYASQIFDLVAINNYWQRQHPPLTYIEGRPTGQGDTGERLVKSNGAYARDNQGNELHQPFLDCRAMITIGRELGIKTPFLIANQSADAASGMLVGSEKQLGERLQALQGEGRLPAVIFVHSGNKLFTGSYGEGGSGGWHVITVDNYDAKTGTVHISNQWGSANDRTVSVNDLYDATLPPRLWAKGTGVYDRQQYEVYHHYMVNGDGAGLDKNQVQTNTEFSSWLIKQRQEFEKQQHIQGEVDRLQQRLEKAKNSKNHDLIDSLTQQIQHLQENMRQ